MVDLMDVLATLDLTDLYVNPKMRIPTRADWAKVPAYMEGRWPVPVPHRTICIGGVSEYGAVHHQIAPMMDKVPPGARVIIDTEYVPGRYFGGKLLTIGMGWRRPDGIIEGFQIDQWPRLDLASQLAFSQALARLARGNCIVFQNTLADAHLLADHCGLAFPDGYGTGYEDTMLAHAVLWSEWPHGLDFLESMYSPYPRMKHLAGQDPLLYNWGDVLSTIVAWEHLYRELMADPPTEAIYREQSLRLLPELYRAKRRGIRVNGPRVEPAFAETAHKIEQAQQLAQAHTGWPFNLGSLAAGGHMQKYVYGTLGLPVQKNRKTRKPTLDMDAIATLRNLVGVAPDDKEAEEGLTFEEAIARTEIGADPILEARVIYSGALQTQSHYLEPARRALAYGDGRFYPDQLIHAQTSGRWSTNDPPLAQLPADLRDIICADPGSVWLGWDWDQIELRINAALSGDAPSIQAFAQGWDIHTLNACDLFGLPYPPNRLDPYGAQDPLSVQWRLDTSWQGKDDLRRVFAKRFVYRLDYGGDPARAGDIPGAKALGLTSSLLVRASNRYLAQHPQKAEWRRQVALEANTTRISRTFRGRRRRLLGDSKKAIREAFNQPMQGGVVDVFNTTFVQITEQFPWLGWAYGMHDSQNWACPLDRVSETVVPLRQRVTQEWDIAGVKTRFPATFKPKELFA
jgi:hypothetical protein